MEKEDIGFLLQKIDSMKQLALKFEEFYEKKDLKNFNQAKREMIEIQEQILKMLK